MSSLHQKIIRSAVIASVAFSLSACSGSPVNQSPLGPISATGTLIPADISLLRRGTHIFMIDGEKKYYVESKTENLVQVEGQTVHIEGLAEANTTKDDLPVLVVSNLQSVKGEDGLHLWNIPALDLQIQTPNAWKGNIQKNVVTFTLPQEEIPLLTISVSGTGSLPLEGNRYFLSGHRAVRQGQKNGTGIINVFIQTKYAVLELHFNATTQTSIERVEDAKLLESEFEYALNSLKFLSDKSSQQTASGSGITEVCGGFGNVLCNPGSFCDITDAVTNTGVCKQLKK